MGSTPSDPQPHGGHVVIHEQFLVLLDDLLGQLAGNVDNGLVVLRVMTELETGSYSLGTELLDLPEPAASVLIRRGAWRRLK